MHCWIVKGGSNKKGNNFGKSESKLRTNPMNSDGNIMRCHECDSTKCPYRRVGETNMTAHITLVTGKADSGTGSKLVGSLGKEILDSACTKTVSGEEWTNILKI